MVSRVHYTFLRTFHTILVISFHLSYITWYNFSSAIGEWIVWAWLLLLFLCAALFNSFDDKFAPKIRARHSVWRYFVPVPNIPGSFLWVQLQTLRLFQKLQSI